MTDTPHAAIERPRPEKVGDYDWIVDEQTLAVAQAAWDNLHNAGAVRAPAAAAPVSERDLLTEVRQFIHFSPWQDDVPAVPDTPVGEWGTLAWARLAFALLIERAER